ncbi:leucine-rich repeat-containing G-protein coupled receptor 5-like [Saccostrea echinata]|uniref:leucine-rich repeat-containing G-protein coupled receptor 5-like n=1 Tax=Saccostrea echinata TaxID=191078 RepID=UPI002A8184AB|nr:leucine-rich repeat-containing G-protein coupled receptor 5-like [Saccostrea echinata]
MPEIRNDKTQHCASTVLTNMCTVKVALLFFSFAVQCLSCPFPPPCLCDARSPTVYCRSLNMTSLPKINPANGSWTVFLNNNKLRHLPSNAFFGIKVHMLVLDNNEIVKVDDHAFNGSEDSLIFLELAGNKLSSLPSAIARLQNIMSLSVSQNPLTDLDQEVIANISKSLLFLDFGSSEMLKFPRSIKLLKTLASIDLSDVTFTSLPEDAFQPFVNSLNVLGLHNTSLAELPSSINLLNSLQNLKLDRNRNLSAAAISKSVPNGLPGLTDATFQNNGLSTLPNIFLKASHLYIITVLDEPISSLGDDCFTPNFSSNFQVMRMNNTQLTRVPSCLSSVESIKRLEITYNNISSIEEDDFMNMKNLNILVLSWNPITNVSDKAFERNDALSYLIFEQTKLQYIPRAIQNLKSPQLLNLSGCHIQCTCENLGWMKQWKRRPDYFQIVGECWNLRMNLMTFIKGEIPKCPN